jgi:RNA polymerase sigma-70 factor (ECF subfamily)
MTERNNDEWIADLAADPAGGDTRHAEALKDLRQRLERGVFYYLRNDRSDLSDYTLDVLEQMAQDFTQDALLKILDNLDSFRGESQFITWATKIAMRVAISELRRARYKDYSLEHLTADGETMPSITSLAISPEGAPPPENYAERREVLAIIDDALSNALTERQRIALVAYTIDGVPVEEIAQQMHTNRNALYKLVHDARMKLKHYMEDQGLTLDYILDLFE